MHTHTHAYGFDSLDYTVYGLYNPTRIEKLKLRKITQSDCIIH